MTTRYAVGDHDTRPWGTWEVLASADDHVVKRIVVNPGGKLSLQYHHHREEHWVVVSGEAVVTRGEEQLTLGPSEHVHLPLTVVHRVENRGSEPLVFIETQLGDELDEDDIVRVEDVYGRTG
ncbi:MAG: phosphomannose isomerase type II C-terminal cupin domain [Geminicoccaceae bacterium]